MNNSATSHSDPLTDELIAAVAREQGIALGRDDPVFAILTANRIVLGAYLERALAQSADTHAQWVGQVERARRELKAFGPMLEHAATAGREALQRAALDEAAKAKADLGAALAATAQQVAQQVAGRRMAGAVMVASLGAALALAVAVAAMAAAYATGTEHGRRAERQDRQEAAEAASWGATADGQLARRLWLAGSLRTVAECSAPGWQRKRKDGRKTCYPMAAKDGIHGWRLPD